MFYIIWVPSVILLYTAMGWLAVKNNAVENKWYLISFLIVQLIPLWVIVTKFSKNLIFDGMLYDVLIFLVSTISIGYFSNQIFHFNIIQYIGLAMVTIGFILMQIKK
jgi:hypothetical protein